MVNILLTVSYANRADDERVQRQIKTFVQLATEEASGVHGLKKFVYLNYAAAWQVCAFFSPSFFVPSLPSCGFLRLHIYFACNEAN